MKESLAIVYAVTYSCSGPLGYEHRNVLHVYTSEARARQELPAWTRIVRRTRPDAFLQVVPYELD